MPSPLSLMGIIAWFAAGFCMGAGWTLSSGLVAVLRMLLAGH